jgi:hypothetical protein
MERLPSSGFGAEFAQQVTILFASGHDKAKSKPYFSQWWQLEIMRLWGTMGFKASPALVPKVFPSSFLCSPTRHSEAAPQLLLSSGQRWWHRGAADPYISDLMHFQSSSKGRQHLTSVPLAYLRRGKLRFSRCHHDSIDRLEIRLKSSIPIFLGLSRRTRMEVSREQR